MASQDKGLRHGDGMAGIGRRAQKVKGEGRSARVLTRTAGLLFLAGTTLLGACAVGPRTERGLSAQEAAALSATGRVWVTGNDPGLQADVVLRLRRGGEVAVAERPESGVPELRLRFSCGTDFDHFREPWPINAPSSGEGPDTLNQKYQLSPNAVPACEARVSLFVGGLSVWSDSARSSSATPADVRSLADFLTERFLADRRRALAGAGSPRP